MNLRHCGDTSMRKYTRGITLLELMIVVVIIGILTTIAYPSYRQYAQRAKRSEAMSALLQIATNQERFYLNSNEYTMELKFLGFPDAPTYPTATGSYIVDVTFADANTFTAVATYTKSDEEADKCHSFTINATGNKASEPKLDCWTTAR